MRRRAGFVPAVLMELMIVIAMLGIVTAVGLPRFLQVRREAGAHACAAALDTVTDPEARASCPAFSVPYEDRLVGGMPKHCCPMAERHGVEATALCRSLDDPPLASVHRAPATWRWVVWSLLGVAPAVLFAGVFGLYLWLTVSDALARRRR